MRISVNGAEVVHGDLPKPAHLAGLGETFDVGRDSNTPVSDEYQNEGVFTGDIDKVVVDVESCRLPARRSNLEPDESSVGSRGDASASKGWLRLFGQISLRDKSICLSG